VTDLRRRGDKIVPNDKKCAPEEEFSVTSKFLLKRAKSNAARQGRPVIPSLAGNLIKALIQKPGSHEDFFWTPGF
jgi:hypothetical protein